MSLLLVLAKGKAGPLLNNASSASKRYKEVRLNGGLLVTHPASLVMYVR